MIEYLKSYFLFGNQFCGIEHTTKNGKDTIYTSILKKTKNEISVDDSFRFNSIKEVCSRIKKKQHAYLVINNEDVLSKIIEHESSTGINLVNKAFPNLDISDFYFEIISQNSKHFVSICRKNYIDNLILSYNKLDVYITNFSIGNSIISNITHYLKTSSISTSNALITIHDGAIEAINLENITEENTYDINGLQSTSYNLNALSAALSSILQDFRSLSNFDSNKVELANNYNQIRYFGQFIKIGLGVIVSILLINFFFFNFYFEKVNTLQATSQLNQTAKVKIIQLNKEVSKSEKLSNDILRNSESRSSFYTNEIINSLPHSILLSTINYQPLAKRIKAEKAIILDNNTIIISGASNHSSSYSQWISDLEQIQWVSRVDVLNYNDLKPTSSQFSIKVSINDK